MAVCGFSGIPGQAPRACDFPTSSTQCCAKKRAQHSGSTPQLEVRVSTRGIGVRLISMSMTISSTVSASSLPHAPPSLLRVVCSRVELSGVTQRHCGRETEASPLSWHLVAIRMLSHTCTHVRRLFRVSYRSVTISDA
jgi:hypothetical protein